MNIKFFQFKKLNKYIKNKKIFNKPLNELLVKVILAMLLILVILIMLPSERPFEYSNLTVGSVTNREIIADFKFPIIKPPAVLEEERRIAALNVPPVFDRIPNTLDTQKIKLRNLLNDLNLFFKPVITLDSTKKINDIYTDKQVDNLIKDLNVNYSVNLSDLDLNNYFFILREKKNINLLNFLDNVLTRIYTGGIIDIPKAKVEENRISINETGIYENFELSEVLDLKEAYEMISSLVTEKYKNAEFEAILSHKFLTEFVEPNLTYNEELTIPRKKDAINNVPIANGFVSEKERIVDSHEVITEDIFQKLQSLDLANKDHSLLKRGGSRFLFYVGRLILATLLVFIFGLLVRFFSPELFVDNQKLLLITIILLIQFLFTILVVDFFNWNYLSIPIILGPMLLSMLLNSRVALWGTVMISAVLGLHVDNNFFISLMTLFIGIIALLSVRKIRNRGQMFRAIFYILAGYMILNFSWGFLHYESLKVMIQNFGYYYLPNAILTPTAVFLLLGIFEKIFDVTTDSTLLELSDLNRPLLKRLSVEAPGTFHHSIIVGNLAEAAAEAIGANSLLTRVGCYYHDIGKLLKAEYFVENQAGLFNKHENLTPNMSSIILANHVKAGLEMANEYNLPYAVKRFIPEHHGTSIMSYFYHKAKEISGTDLVNEDSFRYPGPKPQSKETAIAMLADTVEAATRSLANPNLARITTLVDTLIEKRINEGELDNCDLTLRDLTKIKGAFMPILVGIHHLRIEYPSDSEEDNDAKKRQGKSKATKSAEKQKKNELDSLDLLSEKKNEQKPEIIPNNSSGKAEENKN